MEVSLTIITARESIHGYVWKFLRAKVFGHNLLHESGPATTAQVYNFGIQGAITHRLHSSSFLGFPYRILNMNSKRSYDGASR